MRIIGVVYIRDEVVELGLSVVKQQIRTYLCDRRVQRDCGVYGSNLSRA
jgi:hypothetical protein